MLSIGIVPGILLTLLSLPGALLSPVTIHSITPANIHEFQSPHRPTLAIFSVDWCDHCRSLYTSLDRMAGTLPGMAVGVVDCDLYQSWCQSIHHISSYPSVHIFIEHRRSKYLGRTNADSILQWAQSILSSNIHDTTGNDSLGRYMLQMLRADDAILIYSGQRSGGLFELFAKGSAVLGSVQSFIIDDSSEVALWCY